MALLKKSDYDVSFAGGDMTGVSMDIASCLESKGFCILDPCLSEEDMQKARQDVEEGDSAGKLLRPPELVVEGLLGTEGSARIMELDRPDPESTAAPGLTKIDTALTETAAIMDECLGALGFSCPTRTVGLVHETGMPTDEAPELGMEEASSWLTTFIRHRLMLIYCLGPIKGTLELRPFDEDAEAFEVPTNPGSIIVLRCDSMTHRHFAHSKACLLSCFLLEGKPTGKTETAMQDLAMIPVAKEIYTWTMTKMKEAKEAEYEYNQPAEVPACWVNVMNHQFHCVQRVAVRGMAGRYAGTYHQPTWYKAQTAGVDYVQEIPLARWSAEEYYDSNPECWRYGKCYLKHGSFMEGADLFDNRFFGLSVSEASGMDPHQREVLECGYDALSAAGYKKGKIMNSLGGVYLGSSMTIFGQVSTVSGATGGAASINSNRFSFCLGLKGPSLTVDTEGSSSLTAVYLGAEAVLNKGRGQINAYSLSGGVAFQLGTMWWPQLQSAGLLCPEGRCLTWDQSASGYCMADGVNFCVLKRLMEIVEGEQVEIEGEPRWGVIAACAMNSNGVNASMNAPNGPSEQELVAEAVRNAGLVGMNIDAVECNGQAAFMADAIEVDSLNRVLRGEDVEAPLCLTAMKSNMGHGHECAGMISFQRAVLANNWGVISPNNHLCQLNPHIEPENKTNYITENTEYAMVTSYTGVTSRGFGGTNVHVITFGECDPCRLTPLPEEVKRDAIAFWPGGGGELEESQEPRRGYFIAGTWSKWSPVAMESEGVGSWGYTVTLGENKWEDFQIVLDGDKSKCLHPALPKAHKGSAVNGPDYGVQGLNWRIMGFGGLPAETPKAIEGKVEEGALAVRSSDSMLKVVSVGSADSGEAGDQYRVHFKVMGKYRTVMWEKVGHVDPATAPASEYFVTANWNGWTFDKMTKDGDAWSLEVHLLRAEPEFQIVRNEDWGQVICPTRPCADASEPGYGPDDGVAARGITWAIGGKIGEVYKISATRGEGVMKVSWDKVRDQELTEEQRAISKYSCFSVVGSWAGWVRQTQLTFGGQPLGQPAYFYFFVQIGPDGQESFQLLQDCNWDRVVHPNIPVESSYVPHTVYLSANDGHAISLVWTIGPGDGANPGDVFMVKVFTMRAKVLSVKWERSQGGKEVEEAYANNAILRRE